MDTRMQESLGEDGRAGSGMPTTDPLQTTQDALECLYHEVMPHLQALEAKVPMLLDPTARSYGRKREDHVVGPRIRKTHAQLQIVCHALELIRTTLAPEVDDANLDAPVQAIHAAVQTFKQLTDVGWFEHRPVWRTTVRTVVNPETGHPEQHATKKPYGPYVYYRWIEGERRRSVYLGKVADLSQWRWKLAELGLAAAHLSDAELDRHIRTLGTQ